MVWEIVISELVIVCYQSIKCNFLQGAGFLHWVRKGVTQLTWKNSIVIFSIS